MFLNLMESEEKRATTIHSEHQTMTDEKKNPAFCQPSIDNFGEQWQFR
jgi:hypothetical protein